jgi:hypothetical protein
MNKKKVKYTQCDLKKGNFNDTSWIPSEFAKQNKIVKVFNVNEDKWDDGWTVVATYNTMTLEELQIQQEQTRNTRKASDI